LGYQDPESGTPCYKSIPVRIRRTDQTVLASED
jgi:formylmethanofuran dehydrogenase subunit D